MIVGEMIMYQNTGVSKRSLRPFTSYKRKEKDPLVHGLNFDSEIIIFCSFLIYIRR